MKYSTSRLITGLSFLLLSGCASMTSADLKSGDISLKTEAAKPPVRVETHMLTYDDIKSLGSKIPELNERLMKVAPEMAHQPGTVENHFVIPVAAIAGFATKELVNWLGIYIDDEAKKHSAKFAAFVDRTDWWADAANRPNFAAVELTRTRAAGKKDEVLFDAIVLIRPVVLSGKAYPVAYQLIPVYLLETEPAAKDFGHIMGAVFSVQLEGAWSNGNSDPVNATFSCYTYTVKEYEVGKPFFFVKKAEAGTIAETSTSAEDQSEYSHYLALPNHQAALAVTFGVAETDPSKWVDLLEKLGTAISGQAGNAGSAVQNRLTPPSS